MRFTVLGKYGPYPPEDGATSGYLLECADLKILLDCGSGTAARLQRLTALEELDAVVISHLHQDHISDLGVLNYAMQMLTKKGLRQGKLPVYLPGAPADVLAMIEGFDHMRVGVYANRLDFTGLSLTFHPVRHPVPCYAMLLHGEGRTLFYSGDTAYFEGLMELVQGANCALMDACFLGEHPEGPHLSAHQAAMVARQAGIEQLYLTHMPPYADEAAYRREAGEVFPGAQVVREMESYTV
ncbi:MBL fold metallo-hydrolase [Gehongia tenuis]|uniref:MBL fold metallo-hydrolase n=1 Tax=Gehongia tenuis TaxID=2763655 RepID=A0A926D3Y4_9FIRM|nr:MBL fold metallo-hydrolase [Gehongia tenuis]MBC8531009.1 MBL fold metallo-hydrolase [Gehongia tenuis]